MKRINLGMCALLTLQLSLFVSCNKEDSNEPFEEEPGQNEYALGWSGDDNLGTIPTSTNFSFGNTDLPTSVNLVPKFPPIGDQGRPT